MANKVLIIEDDIFLGDVLVRKLKGAGYTTMLARDGAAGLEQLKEWKPDLLLLDIILPKMNGYEVLEAKAKDPHISEIPVIIISNSGQPVEISRALSLGVKDYLIKAQFDPEEVIVKVRSQLGAAKTPAPPKGGAQAVQKRERDEALKGKKIMWVEDDQFLSEIIARKLGAAGCILLHAADGGTAWKLLEKEKPDLILLDILLAGLDGYEILKRIKANKDTAMIPVILLSNLGQKEDLEKGKKLGAARFLIKATVTLDEIVQEIKTVLRETGGKNP